MSYPIIDKYFLDKSTTVYGNAIKNSEVILDNVL